MGSTVEGRPRQTPRTSPGHTAGTVQQVPRRHPVEHSDWCCRPTGAPSRASLSCCCSRRCGRLLRRRNRSGPRRRNRGRDRGSVTHRHSRRNRRRGRRRRSCNCSSAGRTQAVSPTTPTRSRDAVADDADDDDPIRAGAASEKTPAGDLVKFLKDQMLDEAGSNEGGHLTGWVKPARGRPSWDAPESDPRTPHRAVVRVVAQIIAHAMVRRRSHVPRGGRPDAVGPAFRSSVPRRGM